MSKGTFSKWVEYNNGVSQGFLTPSFHILIYINDLHKGMNS